MVSITGINIKCTSNWVGGCFYNLETCEMRSTLELLPVIGENATDMKLSELTERLLKTGIIKYM